MRACVRNYDSRFLAWFEVAQGLYQGGVFSSLLFNVFFVAILLVALETFSEDTDILVDLHTCKNNRQMLANGTILECVRHVIGGMMYYADDACIASRSPRG